jgi:hypothetical protein
MIAVGVFFLIPAILYIIEGGPMIALLPLFLAVVSFVIAFGLYLLKKIAWIMGIVIGFVGILIFMADWVNVNIESYLGFVFCVILIIGLVMFRKYYL